MLPRASEQGAAAGRNQTARVQRLPAKLRRKRKRPAPSHQIGLQQTRAFAQTCSPLINTMRECFIERPHIVDLQQRKNTARISWSHKIERLWQFNHRYFWRMTSSKYTLGDARMTPRRLCCFERTFSRRDYSSVRQLAPQATTARSGERTCNVGSRATRKRHRR